MAAEPRLALAEAFLQEAIYRSRERQAVGVSLLPAKPDGSSPTNCGLGQQAALVLDLSPKARELFAALWPEEPGADELERLRTLTAGWVERQDALDRDRNHFLRDFRKRHGADRTGYSEELAAAFESGLEAINARETEELHAAAAGLLA